LYGFNSLGDGSNPFSGVILARNGNLFGVTPLGGGFGIGTIYEVTPSGSETILYSFMNRTGGGSPQGNLVADKSGDLYGAACTNGAFNNGSIFRLSPTNVYKVIHNFRGKADGSCPTGSMVMDKLGNLYGTAVRGGKFNAGTVFRLTPAGQITVLYHFTGGNDGLNPQGGLALTTIGNIYGTTLNGGTFGLGTVFEISHTGSQSVLWNFSGGADSRSPNGGLVFHGGAVYGTTATGGTGGAGIVFAAHPHSLAVVYSFTGFADGGNPPAGIVFDRQGNLYGTTSGGGANFQGTVFKVSLAAPITETVLHSFSGNPDGTFPFAPLAIDPKGNLYGTTADGGDPSCSGNFGCGVVFKITP
jgi:uncharacterized repeat protein (TIGR03803 family)